MPGVDKKQEIAGATCYATQQEQNGSVDENAMDQPRQPANLQGLLRYAMDAAGPNAAPSLSGTIPMDAQRRTFLETALKDMTVDVEEVLKEQVGILKNVDSLTADGDAAKYLSAIYTMLDFIDDINIAKDFFSVGGMQILKPCLKCPNPEVRIGGCELIAELSQNNLICQIMLVEAEFIPFTLQILDAEPELRVSVKIVYAISCMTRSNMAALQQILQYGGLDIFLKALKGNNDKLRTKITFLLSSLCQMEPDLKSRLVFLEYIPVLVSLLSEERMPSHEHVLSLLVSIVEENQSAANECKNPRYNLKAVLEKYVEAVKDKPECMEEERYCNLLIRILFARNSVNSGVTQ